MVGKEYGAFNRDTTAAMLKERAAFARLPPWLRTKDEHGEDVDDGVDQVKRLAALRRAVVAADEAGYEAKRAEGVSHEEALNAVLGRDALPAAADVEEFGAVWDRASAEAKKDFVARLNDITTFRQAPDVSESTAAVRRAIVAELRRGEYGPATAAEWDAFVPLWLDLLAREHATNCRAAVVQQMRQGVRAEDMRMPPKPAARFADLEPVEQERARNAFLERIQRFGYAATNPATLQVDAYGLARLMREWRQDHAL